MALTLAQFNKRRERAERLRETHGVLSPCFAPAKPKPSKIYPTLSAPNDAARSITTDNTSLYFEKQTNRIVYRPKLESFADILHRLHVTGAKLASVSPLSQRELLETIDNPRVFDDTALREQIARAKKIARDNLADFQNFTHYLSNSERGEYGLDCIAINIWAKIPEHLWRSLSPDDRGELQWRRRFITRKGLPRLGSEHYRLRHIVGLDVKTGKAPDKTRHDSGEHDSRCPIIASRHAELARIKRLVFSLDNLDTWALRDESPSKCEALEYAREAVSGFVSSVTEEARARAERYRSLASKSDGYKAEQFLALADDYLLDAWADCETANSLIPLHAQYMDALAGWKRHPHFYKRPTHPF